MGRLARVNINMSEVCVIMMEKCLAMVLAVGSKRANAGGLFLAGRIMADGRVDYDAYDVQDGPWT